jgi:hypothetical protein
MTPPFMRALNLVPVDDYLDAVFATPVASAQRDLQFFTSTASGATILGTLQTRTNAPLAGVRIEITSPAGVREAITTEDGSFMASGIGSGRLTLKPFLNDDLGVVNTSALTFEIVEGGCKTVRLTAALNGRVSGRIISATGKSLAGVEIVLQSELSRTTARPSEDGTFQFSGQIPGSYLLSAHLDTITTFYPGVPDAASATPIIIGRATQHDGFDFLVMTE